MKILLDNCIDRNFTKLIRGHDVSTAVEVGWADLENGRLLASAAQRFDLLITVDKNIRYQQNLAKLPIAIVELDVPRNQIDALAQLASFLPAAINLSLRYLFVSLKSDGSAECLAERTERL